MTFDPPAAPPVNQPDPILQQQQERADKDNLLALQDLAKADTASIMTRFGSLAAYAQGAKG
jgi:hypothetical protein